MTDIVGTARSAREMLARGLNALQSDPNAPAEFLSAAEPIAMAMGALHRIERSGGAELAAAAPVALENVRGALSLLQAKAGSDARFSVVLEEVAGSLGMVFSLNKAASYGPAPAQPAPQPAPAQPAAPYSPPPAAQQPFAAPAQAMRPAMQPQPAPAPAYAPPAQAFAPQPQPAHQAAPWQQPQPAPQAQAYPQPAPAPQAVPAYGPPPQQAFAPQPYAPPQQAQPYAPPQQAYAPPPQAYAPPQQSAPQPPAAQPLAAAGYRDAEKLPLVEAELGTHSVSNFYRGLSGNDIIENGGIFVSTYNIPEIGQRLRLRVALPGGLEFEALGVVRWVREARESMASDISPPGFGLQFTNISAEGRNLVYRYVRNREPMFHDDL